MASRNYPTAFKRHLSFFDHDANGTITFTDSLKASLSLGLNFPVAVVAIIGFPLLYGNTGFLSTSVDVSNAKPERTQLEDLKLRQDSYSRADLMQIAQGLDWINWMHILGMWALAAGNDGRVSSGDVALFQKGTLLHDLVRRRRDRSNVLPLSRGGPYS